MTDSGDSLVVQGRCEHDNYEMVLDAEERANLSEGICSACKTPGQRTDDGFTSCSCCGVAWRIDALHITVRTPYSMEPNGSSMAAEP